MRGVAIGTITASKSSNFPIGTLATGMVGWTEFAIAPAKSLEAVNLPSNARVTDALGVLGMTGLTAYFGITEVGQVKAGDFVVVSGAAGATGSVVAQIAKIKGARVLGLAGSESKCRWLKEELGLDEALNYKDKDFIAKFRGATKVSLFPQPTPPSPTEYRTNSNKSLIDVFFDNVGGSILDLALSRAKPHSRFICCGAISDYNNSSPQGLKNYMMIISMRIRMQGFIVFDYADKYDEARNKLPEWLKEGRLRRKETVVEGGLGPGAGAWRGLFRGVTPGTLLGLVANAEEEGGQGEKARL